MLGNGIVNGMYNPAIVWASDTGLFCDGVNDFAQYTLSAGSQTTNLVNSFTVSMWIKTPETFQQASYPQRGLLQIKKGTDRNNHSVNIVYDASDSKIKIIRTNNANNSSQEVNASFAKSNYSQGFHLAVTCNKDDMIGYINSQKVTSSQSSATDDWVDEEDEGYNIFIGAISANSMTSFNQAHTHDINFFQGIYNNAAIIALYNSGEPKNERNSSYIRYTFDQKNQYDSFQGDATIQSYV